MTDRLYNYSQRSLKGESRKVVQRLLDTGPHRSNVSKHPKVGAHREVRNETVLTCNIHLNFMYLPFLRNSEGTEPPFPQVGILESPIF